MQVATHLDVPCVMKVPFDEALMWCDDSDVATTSNKRLQVFAVCCITQ